MLRLLLYKTGNTQTLGVI